MTYCYIYRWTNKKWVICITPSYIFIRKITQKVSLMTCYLMHWTLKKNSKDEIQQYNSCNFTGHRDANGMYIMRSCITTLLTIVIKKSISKQAGSVAYVTRINLSN